MTPVRATFVGAFAILIGAANAWAQPSAEAPEDAPAARRQVPSTVEARSAPPSTVEARPAPPSTVEARSAPPNTRAASRAQARMIVEFGLLDPLAHDIQFGRNGTRFDYVSDGGQDVLFPTTRLSLEAIFARRHQIIFLYQPIDIRTAETLREELRVDNVRFPAGTPLDFRYGFDFYRVSYLYDFLGHGNDELSLGGSLQLRNAVIDFSSADGSLRRSNRDVGPVPALKSRGRFYLGEKGWLGYEADGMYAPVKYINGGSSDVVGAILDFSLRVGYNFAPPLDVFLNLRYLGGGAKGTSQDDAERGPGDGYTSNWLHFTTTTLGVELKLERLFTREE